MLRALVALSVGWLAMCPQLAGAQNGPLIQVPRLAEPPVIDGDLAEWKEIAFTDGVWDIYRLRSSPWYDPWRNRVTDHGDEPPPADDLQARYYMAWDATYLYLGAEVLDNVNDVDDPAHEGKRWYFKDCVCWFVEAPRDRASEFFGRGDNAFCFVIDPEYPSYGAWWRHGTADQSYVEEALPPAAVDYRIALDPQGRGRGDFHLEVRVNMAATFGLSDPSWQPPEVGDLYSVQIVHTDPDGGGYGGHFLVYGRGDDDSTWQEMVLGGPARPLERRSD